MPDNSVFSWLIDASAWVIPVVLAVTLHEAAHGYAAERFGDKTAREAGRVTLNPLKHIDRVGTLLLPALLLLAKSPVIFGYAKPVPVDFNRLRPLRAGMLAVAAAGPGINLLLAFASALALHLEAWITPEQAPWLYLNIYRMIILNCALAAFNLIPILPLDGGRILAALLPPRVSEVYAETERFGMLAVIGLLLVPPMLGIDLLTPTLGAAVGLLVEGMLQISGNSSTM